MVTVNKKGDPISDEYLSEIQQIANASLPDSYIKFLKENNGGRPEEKMIDFDGGKLRIKGAEINFFFGQRKILSTDLLHNANARKNIFPDGLIGIANTAGGNYFLLSLRPESYGQVFYKDHDFEHSIPLPESIIKVANSFEEFLNRLYDPDA